MSAAQVQSILRYVRRLFRRPETDALSDRQLLEAFADRRDEAAFAALVERHGPLVWGVCRRALGPGPDAEDAFQATFLVLAKKAGAVPWREEVGSWLYAVALRVARKARGQAQRRRFLEREAAAMKPSEAAPSPDPADELATALDEEVRRLPEKYRRPVLLCYFEGRSYTEAARLLGWREGTVAGRLARARDLLRRRLARRGLVGAEVALAAQVSSAGMPPALAASTVQAALAFATGASAASGTAVALAEGVLQTMFLTKLKLAGGMLLALAVAGAGFGFVLLRGQEAPPEPPSAPPAPVAANGDKVGPPPLPKEWAGRWVADPFADAVAFEVKHRARGGPERVYHVKDPAAVAELLKAVQVTGVQNDVHVGLFAPAQITVRRKDGSSFEATLLGKDQVQCWDGIVHLDPRFVEALNRRLSAQEKQDVNVLEFLGGEPMPVQPVERVKASVRSLTAGFTELTISYTVGGRLHRTRIADAQTLDALHKELTVHRQQPVAKEPAQSRQVTIVSKDGSTFHGHIISAEEFFDFDAGRFTVAPHFLKALSKEVGRREGRDIDVTADNPLTEAQLRRAEEFRQLLAGVTALRFSAPVRGGERTFVVDRPAEVAELVGGLRAEAPAREVKAERRSPLLELTTKDGKKAEVVLLETEPDDATAAPLVDDLVEVSGFGRMWVDDQWKYRLRQHGANRERQAREERSMETARLVCRDLPAFLGQVRGVSAHFRQDDQQSLAPLTAAESAPVLRALAAGRLEKLDWTQERWQQEVGGLIDRGAGTLDLAPGLGFSLMVVVRGEKEMLVFPYGRLVFAEGPLDALRRAIDRDNPKAVELLPGEKKPGARER